MSTPEDPNRRRVRKRVEPRAPDTPASPPSHGTFEEGTPAENLPAPGAAQPHRDQSAHPPAEDDHLSTFNKSTQDDAYKPDEAELKRRRREKKKETQKKPAPAPTPDWDQNNEELAAQEAARQAEAEAKGLEKKDKSRRKRKDEPSAFETFFRKMSKVFVLFAGLVILGVTALGTWGVITIGDKYGGEEANTRKSSSLDMSDVLREEDFESALETVKSYLLQESIEKRAKFIRRQEHVVPLMEEFYARAGNDTLLNPSKFQSLEGAKKTSINGVAIILLSIRHGIDHRLQYFAAEMIDGNYLIDWEVSENYQAVPVDEFLSTKRPQPSEFRLLISRSGYYTGQYPEEDYASYLLLYPGVADFRLTGFVERDSELGIQLEEIVYPGKNAAMILSLKNIKYNLSNVVLINAIECRNWYNL